MISAIFTKMDNL